MARRVIDLRSDAPTRACAPSRTAVAVDAAPTPHHDAFGARLRELEREIEEALAHAGGAARLRGRDLAA